MTVWAARADQVDLRGPNPHDLARSRTSRPGSHLAGSKDHRRPAADPSRAGPRNLPTSSTADGNVVRPSHLRTVLANGGYSRPQCIGGSNKGSPARPW